MSTPDLKLPSLSHSQEFVLTMMMVFFMVFRWGGFEDFENHSEYQSFKDDDLQDPNLWCEHTSRDSSEKFVGRKSRAEHITLVHVKRTSVITYI